MKAKHKPKDGVSRAENLITQPHVPQRVFNNHKVLTKGWYPVCESSKIKVKKAESFKILNQRIVVFRDEGGEVRALDAFCPHLGADLGNGRVVGKNIQCYFHQWEFNSQGMLSKVPCQEKFDETLRKTKVSSYPVTEVYGHIWVFSDEKSAHHVLKPSGLEGREVRALYFKEITLFAHHHVMMANGVDLQHFATVHALDIKFNFDVDEKTDGTFVWKLKGRIPKDSLKGKLANFLLGDEFEYHIKFAGGSLITISYGVNAKVLGMKVPSLNVLWGCLPQINGISKVRIFFVTEKRKGLLSLIKSYIENIFTLFLLMMLRDEDIEAFPNMRFNAHRLIAADKSLARFIQLINKCEVSKWGKTSEEKND